jgi:bifunctional non-homologous end joining protein LigD
MKTQTRARDKRATGKARPPRRTDTKARTAKSKPAARGSPGEVAFTNVEKVMFPEAGHTKGDLLKFYLAIAPRLLPHLRDRPVTLERLPDGVREGAPRFWQKNTPPYYPKWIRRIHLPTERGKPVHYALVNDEHALAYLVNQGTVTFHTWFSRTADLDRPDFVVFDLDPAGAPFDHVVRIARTLHDLLDTHGVESFPKTSGKSGLHIQVPWARPGGYDEARAWAMGVAEQAVEAWPDIATTERSKAARGGRVYVDVMQNARGHHAVPPYVVRATPLATVSTPLAWKEVNPRLDPKKFTIATVLKRLKRAGKDLAPPTSAS